VQNVYPLENDQDSGVHYWFATKESMEIGEKKELLTDYGEAYEGE